MKGYPFGLGAMLVGAGLMFGLMHGEVEARHQKSVGDDFLCKFNDVKVWSAKVQNI